MAPILLGAGTVLSVPSRSTRQRDETARCWRPQERSSGRRALRLVRPATSSTGLRRRFLLSGNGKTCLLEMGVVNLALLAAQVMDRIP